MSHARSRSGGMRTANALMRSRRSARNRSCVDERVEPFVCGEDESHIGAHGAIAADGIEVAVFLDDAQQLALNERRRLADLVEEQRAASR